jgi:SLOG-like protein
MTIGIVPSEDAEKANQHCDAVVTTGVGYIRNFLVVYSGDVVIIVGGGAWTMIEAATGYMIVDHQTRDRDKGDGRRGGGSAGGPVSRREEGSEGCGSQKPRACGEESAGDLIQGGWRHGAVAVSGR